MSDLRKYQALDREFYRGNPRSLILYEPRMGKTVVATTALNDDPRCKNINIVAPTNAFYVWEDHIKDWFTRDEVDFRFIDGSADDRKDAWFSQRRAPIRVNVITQAALLRDIATLEKPLLKYGWDTWIFDEYHKWLLHKTKTWKSLRTLTQKAYRVHGLSGTPLERGPYEFWPILYLLDHQTFSSRERFENEFCVWNEGRWGNREYCGLIDPQKWFKFLTLWARVRFRYNEDMPEVTRAKWHYKMTPAQEKIYRDMDKNMFSFGPQGNIIVAANSVEKNIRLRQLLACPAILDPDLGIGGAMEQIIEELTQEEDKRARHVVIFTFFRDALPIFERAIKEAMPDANVFQLHGGLKPDELRRRITAFKTSQGIMLCTTSYAQAFDLSGASACYHVGWSYSANENKQAEDRIIPQTRGNPINSMYCVARNTVEDQIVEAVVTKHGRTQESLRDPNQKEGAQDHPEGNVQDDGDVARPT